MELATDIVRTLRNPYAKTRTLDSSPLKWHYIMLYFEQPGSH